MRHPIFVVLCLGSAVALSACETSTDADVKKAVETVNAIDGANLSEIMLNSTDPAEAVNYFRSSSMENPDRIDLKRGLAKSLVRAGRPTESIPAWRAVLEMEGATNEDNVGLADALIRAGEWDAAEAELDKIPPTYETYRRYRLEAMVADSNQEWDNSDSFYETALGLTTVPSGVLNNWGYSKLTRGDFEGAEKLFAEAITYDSTLFTAKNNLVLARGAQRKYDIPVMEMTQVERAQLMHTMALAAIKQGDVETGKGMLREAMDTHPQHFEAAARSLDALEQNVVN